MALLGHLIVAAHLAFFQIVQSLAGQANSVVAEAEARRWSLIAAGMAVGLWSLVSLVLLHSASKVVPRLVGARLAGQPDENTLASVAEEMAIASGEPVSTVQWYLLESSARNAFACGRSVREGSIVVTRGLLDALDRDELQAVVAHELAHLKNGDAHFTVQALAFAWMVVAVSTVAYVGLLLAIAVVATMVWVTGKVAEGADSEWGGLLGGLAIVAIVVTALVYLATYALLVGIVLAVVAIGVKAASTAISHSREYLADGCAAQWTRNPAALASALVKVAGCGTVSGLRGNLVASLWLERARAAKTHGTKGRLLSFLLDTHPAVERRLELLKEMAGNTLVTDEQWLMGARSSPWQRFKEWGLPLLATALAGVITTASISGFLCSRRQTDRNPTGVQGALPARQGNVNQPTVRMRSAPRLGARILCVLHQGATISIQGGQGDWYLVAWESSQGVYRGWIAKRLVDVRGP
jgi:heat shock protein HtpX